MKMHRLGKTGLQVSVVALGTVEIGMDYGIPSDGQHRRPGEKQAIQFLNHALDLGVNFVDTARVYGNSEDLISAALKDRRHEYILATKLEPIVAADLSNETALRDKVRKSTEESLRRLQTDHLDVLMLHSASLEVVRGSAALRQMLRELRDEGVTRAIGASVYEDAGVAAAASGFDMLQIGYNALDRSPEQETLPLAKQNDVGMVARSVLLKGALTARYKLLPPALSPLAQAASELEALAEEAGISLVELAYRYVLSEDVTALCGTARIEELRDVVSYAERGPLSADLIIAIRQVEVSDRRLLHPGNWPF